MTNPGSLVFTRTDGIRTRDPHFVGMLLYPLSYSPSSAKINIGDEIAVGFPQLIKNFYGAPRQD